MTCQISLPAETRPSTAGFRRELFLAVALLCAGCATAPVAPPSPVAQARVLLQRADRWSLDSAHEVGAYLDAARAALAVVTDEKATPADRAAAEVIYNAAVAKGAAELKKDRTLPMGAAVADFPGEATTYRLRVGRVDGIKTESPAPYDRLIDTATIYRKHLQSNTVREGLGGTLLGVIDSPADVPNRPARGFTRPLTVVASFGAARDGATPVELAFYDPREAETVRVEGETFPLRGDFTAQLAFFPRINAMVYGFMAMLHSDRTAKQSGVYFIEPYNARKTPVLFVQGFMSSPHAWLNFVNDLDRNAEFRRRYQVWILVYPSGAPIATSALHLRDDLAAIESRHPLKRDLVITGYSMGGLLTQMQVTNSGRVLWDVVFGAKADQIYAETPADSILKRTLIYTANPHVSRVIFMSTPHLGSNMADLRISTIASSLIRMPAALLQDFTPQMRALMMGVNPNYGAIPTGIRGLSPESPLLKGLAKLPIQVPYYTILGNRGKAGPLAESSDGVVPYSSSHLAGAQSEVVVPTGHDSLNNPASVAEVERILLMKAPR